MKTIETCRAELKLHRTPITVKTKRELKFSKDPETACVIPEGTEINLYFSEARPWRAYFDYNGSLRATDLRYSHKSYTKLRKPPGQKALENMAMDGVAKTVTGFRTEPDGIGEDGSPSWLLVIGVI